MPTKSMLTKKERPPCVTKKRETPIRYQGNPHDITWGNPLVYDKGTVLTYLAL